MRYPGLAIWREGSVFKQLENLAEVKPEESLRTLNQMLKILCQYEAICLDIEFKTILNLNETMDNIYSGGAESPPIK